MENQDTSSVKRRACCGGAGEGRGLEQEGNPPAVRPINETGETGVSHPPTGASHRTEGAPSTAADLRDAVRSGYARVVTGAGQSCCGHNGADDSGAGNSGTFTAASNCCGTKNVDSFARRLGYSAEELTELPAGANLGLSCGNPTAMASLRSGEVVLDLGSGAGFDVFIAARKVGPEGQVIGVDMTPEMLVRARQNAATAGVRNVEFRLGEIENLPVADASVDVVISNCVINLSPDKPRVFREVARVLRAGGRVAVSDMALLRPLPAEVREDMQAYVGCIAGAVLVDDYLAHMRDAGLIDLEVEQVPNLDAMEDVQDPLYQRIVQKLPSGTRPDDFVASVRVQARKPGA